MIDLLGDLNWLAVVVATLAYAVFNEIYYSPPVLGRAWRAAIETRPEGYRGQPALYIMSPLSYLLTAVVTALLVAALGITEVGDAIELGILLAIGYVIAGLIADANSWVLQRSWRLVWINGLNALISLSGMAVILALWD